ncbi:MAG: DNA starvation/stationary phase protection protein [Hyphomicrobiaceae bacterium]|nr:DNA starvation/stationary phase protection protein [Hyphomicrobiaceae bacterium]
MPSAHAEAQPFGTLRPVALALGDNVRAASVEALNQVLADTIALRDLYKKHHWQVSGATFHQLHLLFDKHQGEQAELIDDLAERVMALGGVSVAASWDVAETTRLARPPKGREAPPDQLRRLLAAHEAVLAEAHEFARQAAENGDDGTNDLLVSQVVRLNEAQSWMVAEHLDGMGEVR